MEELKEEPTANEEVAQEGKTAPKKKPAPKKRAAKSQTKAAKDASEKAIDNLKNIFGKEYGNSVGCIEDIIEERSIMPTGFDTLDEEVLGVGGIPSGCVVEFYGPEASGKGVLAMRTCAQAQRDGKKCFWFDLERQLNKSWMQINGVDTKEMMVMDRSMGAEDVITSLLGVINTGDYSLVVIDSVSALKPKADRESEVGKTQVGRLALLLSDNLIDIVNSCSDMKCTVIFINQIREKIGVMYGNPETTKGGNALKFYASIRLRLQKIKSDKIINEDNEQIGVYTKVDSIKNRYSSADKQTFIPIYFVEYNPTPVDLVLEKARELKIITKRKNNVDPQYNIHYSKGTGRLSDTSVKGIFLKIFEEGRIDEFMDDFEKAVEKENMVIKNEVILKCLERIRLGKLDIEELS